MTIIAVGSVHGSPGASTLALDMARLAGPNSLLIETDPDGGIFAARLLLGLKPGLTDLAAAARTGIDPAQIWNFAQPTGHGCGVVVAHPAAEQVQGALRASAEHIGSALQTLKNTVILDIGRLRPGSPAIGLTAYADRVVVVAAPTLESVVSLTNRANLLNGMISVDVVLTGSEPYSAKDVTIATQLRVWGVIGHAKGRRREASRDAQIGNLMRDLAEPFESTLATAQATQSR